jgi:hypothetical protein
MPIAKHVKGGTVSFPMGGQRVTSSVGRVGEVPQSVLDRHARQGRFEEVTGPGFEHLTADMKRGEVSARSPDVPKVDKFIARHRTQGRWVVTVIETGEMVPLEMLEGKTDQKMPRDEAEAEAARLNTAWKAS